jgi:hypothetical protein
MKAATLRSEMGGTVDRDKWGRGVYVGRVIRWLRR